MTAPIILPNNSRTLVHVAKNWPLDESGWTEAPFWCDSASIGMCNDFGRASLFTPSGTLFKPGSPTSQLVTSQKICGQYVRVSRIDPDGTVVSSEDGATFSPLWYGTVTSRSIAPDNASMAFTNSYQCAGIGAILDSITPPWHFMVAGNGTGIADIGTQPIFNMIGAKRSGNRSVSKVDFGGGVQAYVFKRSNDTNAAATNAQFWTAQDVVEYYLALFYYFSNAGPTFRIGLDSQFGTMEYSEKWDTSGMSCGEAICRVLSQKQGIGFRVGVSPSTFQPYITVKSLTPDAVTIPATAFTAGLTVPANDEQFTVDLTTDTSIQQFSLSEDQSVVTDELVVQMARPWYAVTLSLFDDFVRDWKDDDEDTWAAYFKEDYVGTLNSDFGIARVWRRFKLKPDWNGTCYGGFKLPSDRLRTASIDNLHGEMGLDGSSSASTPENLAPGPAFTLTQDLPMLDGYDWSAQDPLTVDKTRKNASAMCFAQDGTQWSLLGAQLGMDSVGISVDGELGAITFDSSVANPANPLLLSAWETDTKVYITIGIYGQFNDAVSWRRANTDKPRDQLRTFIKSRPELIRKIVPQGTIVGVTGVSVGAVEAGTLLTAPSDVTIHDDTGLANSILAISTPWFSQPTWSIGYTKIGEIDQTYAQPCNMITAVTHFEGDGSTTTEDVLAVVTGVEWTFSEPGATKVTTRRIPIDVEAII